MKKSENKLENIASLKDNKAVDHTDCEVCMEDYYFLMKDNYHEFSMGLRTVLACLAFAEKEGIIPAIDPGWWLEIQGIYPEIS